MICCYAILRGFFSLYVPWLMYSETTRLLFKIDPRPPKKRRSELRMQRKDPQELLKEARANVQNQVWLTSSILDRLVLTIETFMSGLCSCRNSKFGRIVEDGSNQIKNELNIIKFVRQQRFNECAMLNLLNFNQRRLVEQQAKCNLVIWPLAKNVTPLGTQHKTYENSSDYTSDEDFDFLEK
jgi:hypothetical protein